MKKSVSLLLAVSVLIFLFLGFCKLIETDFNKISDFNTIFLFLGMVLIIYIPILVSMFFFKFSFNIGKLVAKKEMIKIDLKTDKDYFRDILKNYGILELAYIFNDFKLKKKDIIAALLSMELKNIIKVENRQIIYIDRNKDIKESENYLLNNEHEGRVNITNIRYITNIVKNEALNNGLLKRNESILKDIISMFLKVIIFNFITGIITIVYSNIIFNNVENTFLFLIGIIILVLNVLSIYRFVYLASYIYHKVTNYELTEEGIEIKKNLNGLMRFIKDFGDLDNDPKKSLEIWEDYLIYAIIFKNNKVIEENEYKNIVKINNKKLSSKIWFIIFFIISIYILMLF